MRGSFKSFVKQVERSVDAALSESSGQLAGDVRARAPVGETGELADSVESVKVSNCQYQVVIDSDHAVDVEYGNSRQAAQPFARPAFDTQQSKIEKNVIRAIRDS